jgi:uncharacterized protein (DUF169 family)
VASLVKGLDIMDLQLKEKFVRLWKVYFNGAELPIAFYYTDESDRAEAVKASSRHRCFIGDLFRVRKGISLSFDKNSIGCQGGKRYLGFSDDIMPNFEYFLSCGIPGKLEGERYKKAPQMVKEAMKNLPSFVAPGKYIVFKRWDRLEKRDTPEVVIFFALPEVLSGLFTLANFDEIEPNGVFAPFSAGCASIVQYPYLEKNAARPRCVLGMFDVSARPFVGENMLSFAVPGAKFVRMIENMEESFLITSSWSRVRRRIMKISPRD